jgi:hypothetical protein
LSQPKIPIALDKEDVNYIIDTHSYFMDHSYLGLIKLRLPVGIYKSNDDIPFRGNITKLDQVPQIKTMMCIDRDKPAFSATLPGTREEQTSVPHTHSMYFVFKYDPQTRLTLYLEQNLGHKPTLDTVEQKTGLIVKLTDKTVIMKKIVANVTPKVIQKCFQNFVTECNVMLFVNCNF